MQPTGLLMLWVGFEPPTFTLVKVRHYMYFQLGQIINGAPRATQTRPSPTNPGRPPSSGHTDASTESWRATLHQQGVA